MNESIQIAAIVVTPFLVAGALLYFTRRNRKRQFYLLLPILFVANVWLGYAHGWRTLDFLQLGFLILWGIIACFFMLRPTGPEMTPGLLHFARKVLTGKDPAFSANVVSKRDVAG